MLRGLSHAAVYWKARGLDVPRSAAGAIEGLALGAGTAALRFASAHARLTAAAVPGFVAEALPPSSSLRWGVLSTTFATCLVHPPTSDHQSQTRQDFSEHLYALQKELRHAPARSIVEER